GEGRRRERRRDLRADGRGRRRRRPAAHRGGGEDPRKLRLEILNGDHAPAEALGVIKTLMYRPDVFGGWFSDELDVAMRGPSEWSAGERELFAGFASHLNQCVF